MNLIGDRGAVSEPGEGFGAACAAVRPTDVAAARAAAQHHQRLTKPPGALGRLEATGVRLAGIARRSPPPVPEPAAVAVFVADHGVVAEGVTPWPQEVTLQMLANFLAGGAAINVLARQLGVAVAVVDVGLVSEAPAAWAAGGRADFLRRRIRAGTANLRVEPAMTEAEAGAALDVGAEVAADLVDRGARCLLTGDMGIGNTTPSAALVAALAGLPPAEVVGRGSGVDDAGWVRKVAVIEDALARPHDRSTPLAVLASLGGLEIAALAGFVVGGAAAGVPVVVDGVVAAAGLLVAARMCPSALGYCFAGHLSTEPGSGIVLSDLGLEPLLDLGLRLGEGTGACLALPLLQASARVLAEMATFDSAGITGKTTLGG
jgi:nicotinate-nucleotide--dimethylbenzimidazole phosphoribosyltransferase